MKRIKILFVCHGKICRSPMAEFIMKRLVSERHLEECFEISSAATSTEELGNEIYPPALRCLKAHGFEKVSHRARQIKKSDYEYYDLIIGMDNYNISNMLRCFGSDPDNKVCMLNATPISDPWFTDDFETPYSEITQGCKKLLSSLELSAVINYHVGRYPKMQAQDLIKLIFQNEFGPAHMIDDENRAFAYLKEEYAGVSKDLEVPVVEPIGNGFVRANLAALKDEVELKTLCDNFVKTANNHNGSESAFLSKLAYVNENFSEFGFDFSLEEYKNFLDKYNVEGLHPVHHSELFRKLYSPSYRVVSA